MRWVIWWFALVACYLAAAQAQVGTEAAAGAVIALIAAGIAARAFSEPGCDVRVPPAVLRRYSALPARMAGDAFRVCGAILRALARGDDLSGFFTHVPFRPAAQGDPLDQGREAAVVYGVCAAPNSIVTEVDARGSLLVHELQARPLQTRTEEWPL